jgi:hypothetical protein
MLPDDIKTCNESLFFNVESFDGTWLGNLTG